MFRCLNIWESPNVNLTIASRPCSCCQDYLCRQALTKGCPAKSCLVRIQMYRHESWPKEIVIDPLWQVSVPEGSEAKPLGYPACVSIRIRRFRSHLWTRVPTWHKLSRLLSLLITLSKMSELRIIALYSQVYLESKSILQCHGWLVEYASTAEPLNV